MPTIPVTSLTQTPVVVAGGATDPAPPPAPGTLLTETAVLIVADPETADGPLDVLRESMFLAEFNTEQERVNVRANLGLQDIDCGEFF